MFRRPVPTHTQPSADCDTSTESLWSEDELCTHPFAVKCLWKNALYLTLFLFFEAIWGRREAQDPPSFYRDVTCVGYGFVSVCGGPELASVVQTDSLRSPGKLGGFLCLNLTLSATLLQANRAGLTCCNTTGVARYTHDTWHLWWKLTCTNTHMYKHTCT